jgi:hypothetical protein
MLTSLAGQESSRSTMSLKTLLIIATLSLGLVIAVVACGEETTEAGDAAGGTTASIVGKWENPETSDIIEFTADGKFVSAQTENLDMSYALEGNEIMFSTEHGSGTAIEYSLDGDTLKMKNLQTGEFDTLVRVK